MTPPTADALQAHAPFLHRLARSLLHDDGLAHDVVQETMIAALQRPQPQKLRAWLASVTRRLAYKQVRTDSRRRRRERVAARRESLTSTVEVAARLETQSRLVQTVQALPENYRLVIVWRYFDNLSPRDIARRAGVPVKTIETRLRRARHMLRERLDSSPGGRSAWCLALVALLPESRTAAASLATATTTTTGVFVTTKSSLVLGAAFGVVAFFVGWKIMPQDESTNRTDSRRDVAAVSPHDYAALKRRLAESETAAAALRAELDAIQPEEPEVAPDGDRPIAVAPDLKRPRWVPAGFEDAVKAIDWERIGESMANMPPILAEVMQAIENGDEMPPNAGQLQRWNGPLVTEALKAQQSGLSGTGINGVFSHPAMAVNTVFAALDAAKLPLSTQQSEALKELGARVLEEDRVRLAGYGETTASMRKLIDETTLKDRLVAEIEVLLTKEQRLALRPDATRDLLADPYGSSIVLGQYTRPVPVKDRASFQAGVTARFAQGLGIDDALEPVLTEAVRRWTESLPDEFLDVAAPKRLPLLKAAHVQTAARYQMQLIDELAKLPLSADQRKKLTEHLIVLVPVRR